MTFAEGIQYWEGQYVSIQLSLVENKWCSITQFVQEKLEILFEIEGGNLKLTHRKLAEEHSFCQKLKDCSLCVEELTQLL